MSSYSRVPLRDGGRTPASAKFQQQTLRAGGGPHGDDSHSEAHSEDDDERAPLDPNSRPDDIELQSSRRTPRRTNATPLRSAGRRTRTRRHQQDDEEEESESEDEVLFTKEETKKIVRKLDRYLVLFLAILYMLSFLDRSNIGNAKIAGMMEDLQMSSNNYDWLLTGFYITYIAFEWMTLLWGVIPAHIYVPICVTGWGLVASLQGLVPSWGYLLLARALLGVAEAAFGPGVPFYLSFFYKREELAFRIGLFISAAPLSTAYAGSLAYLLTSLRTRLAPWRLLFIVEGWPSLVAAAVAWWWIPDSPQTAWFLREGEERRIAALRLQDSAERQTDYDPKSPGIRPGIRWREIFLAIGDLKNWLTAFMFFSCNVAFSSLPVFLPTIINEMGNSPLSSQALSAPPYIVAFFTVIITSHVSDRLKSRSTFVILHSLMGAFGYAVLGFAPSVGLTDWKWRYAAVFLSCSGIFSAIAIVIPWTVGNSESSEGKGTGVAILNLVGQCGPLLGTRLYPASEGPFYKRGMLTCSVFMVVVSILSVTLRFMMQRENKRRDEKFFRRMSLEAEGGTYKRGREKGFRYML